MHVISLQQCDSKYDFTGQECDTKPGLSKLLVGPLGRGLILVIATKNIPAFDLKSHENKIQKTS